MKAPPTPPPRPWKLAIGTHAPSPQGLAMKIIGGAGLAAAGVISFYGRNDERCSGASEDADATSHGAARHLVRGTPLAAPRIQTTVPSGNRTAQMLSTSSHTIATSDASAERSASMAAAARLTGGKPSQLSIDAQDIMKGATTDTADGATELLDQSAALKRVLSANAEAAGEVESSSLDDNIDGDERPQSSIEDDSYPAFTPYHHSLLKKYLTPAVWAKLSNLKTKHGITIEDIIRAGLALPIGANPPRRVGVLVGDAECYKVFRDLLDPIISEYHGIDCFEEWNDPELPMESYFSGNGATGSVAAAGSASSPSAATVSQGADEDDGVIKSSGGDDDSDDNDDSSFLLDEEDDMFVEYVALPPSKSPSGDASKTTSPPPATRHVTTIASKRKGTLRRHPTIINNPRLVTNREADPAGKYIVSTRVRVARSLDGVKFPTTMSRGDRRRVQRLVDDCTRHFQSPNLANGVYLPVLSMTNDQNLDLIERHVLFDNPNEWTIASGLGRDWPDGRALYANVSNLQSQTPDFMIWVNEEDHLRIMCLRKGGDIQGVFTTVMTGIRELERELTKRGWHFAYDSRLGYLTSCPTNVGTTMRASVHVRLTELGRLPGFFELVHRLKLEARGKYGETDRHYTGVFDISNAERLGKSEVHLINVMVEGVAKLIELERRLEAGEEINIDEVA